jgi:hypothetical protein
MEFSIKLYVHLCSSTGIRVWGKDNLQIQALKTKKTNKNNKQMNSTQRQTRVFHFIFQQQHQQQQKTNIKR